MPTKSEKDSFEVETTGHEWDGIREFNNPLPKWWLYVLYATIAFSLVYYVLYPTIPGITGLMGYSQRVAVTEDIAKARARQAGTLERMAAAEPAEVQQDPELLNFALAGGQAAFADNCAPCHAPGGAGRPGFPVLADDAWLWGGSLEAIRQTILHGVRAPNNDDTRLSDMPAFGADELLERDQIAEVADFVLTLSNGAASSGDGAVLYEENCAACHGERGEGGPDFGAPRLNDQIWLYGDGEKADVVAQISQPRHGVMPAWSGRLDDTTIKMLTVYVHGLGGGE